MSGFVATRRLRKNYSAFLDLRLSKFITSVRRTLSCLRGAGELFSELFVALLQLDCGLGEKRGGGIGCAGVDARGFCL